MEYIGTRSSDVKTDFGEALSREAVGGDKFVPLSLPELSSEFWDKLCAQSFCERMISILSLFADDKEVKNICEAALKAAGDMPALVKTGDGRYTLDLASGATGMADDIAYAICARLLSACRKSRGEDRLALVPFFGSAAECRTFLHAFRGVEGLKAVAFCPDDSRELHLRGLAYERGSGAEAYRVAAGEAEDVKKLFRDMSKDVEAAGADIIFDVKHSIGRILPYVAIFFSAYCDLAESETRKGDEIDVALPSNDLTAAVALSWAKMMGLPVGSMVLESADGAIAELVNDRRFGFGGGLFEGEERKDILIPVNLERFLFEFCGRDAKTTSAAVAELENSGKFEIAADKSCAAYRMTEAGHEDVSYIRDARDMFEEDGVVFDPVTARVASLYELFDCVKGEDRPAIIVQTSDPYLYAEETLALIGGRAVKGEAALRELEELAALERPDYILAAERADGISVKCVRACDIKEEIASFLRERA